MNEVWLDVAGYEGYYSINMLGDVKSVRYDRLLTNSTSRGYKTVNLCVNRKVAQCRVHRLLAIAFIANPHNKPFINHKNGDKGDNSLENLEWCTQKENVSHAHATGLCSAVIGEGKHNAKLDDQKVREIRGLWESGLRTKHSIAREYGVSANTIKQLTLGRTWGHVEGSSLPYVSLEKYEAIEKELEYYKSRYVREQS